MKILVCNFSGGEALIRVEGYDMTFCIDLKTYTTKQEIIDKLKSMIPAEDRRRETFDNLGLKTLEGTDI